VVGERDRIRNDGKAVVVKGGEGEAGFRLGVGFRFCAKGEKGQAAIHVFLSEGEEAGVH